MGGGHSLAQLPCLRERIPASADRREHAEQPEPFDLSPGAVLPHLRSAEHRFPLQIEDLGAPSPFPLICQLLLFV